MIYKRKKYRVAEINMEGDQYYIVQKYCGGMWITLKTKGGSNKRFTDISEARKFIEIDKINAIKKPSFRVIEEL